MTIDATRQLQEEAACQSASASRNPRAGACSRRSLLLLAGGGLLAGMAGAQTAEIQPMVAPAGSGGGQNSIILDPIALAILHHARGDASWSSRQKLRGYMKVAGPTGLFGINPMAAPTANALSPDARAIATAWQNVLLATNVFQRSRDFQKLVEMVDAYAGRVLNADRYYLPLTGQGFLSYDYLDQELLNDAGLVEAGSRFAATRFNTLDHGSVGALQVVNLQVQQLSPSLKAPTGLHRMAAEPDLAERLLKDKAGMYQLLEVQLRGETPKCFPRAEAMKGTPRPLPALAVEFVVIDGTGNKLYSKPIEHKLRQGKKGYCSVA